MKSQRNFSLRGLQENKPYKQTGSVRVQFDRCHQGKAKAKAKAKTIHLSQNAER